jgi:hypothetical protein
MASDLFVASLPQDLLNMLKDIPNFKYAYKQKSEKNHMSNKFLPFITDTSNPEAIFKSIIQRSKGLSERDIVVIYSSVVFLGISKIKSFISTLNAGLSSAEVLNAIAARYRQYEVPVEKFDYWKYILLNYGKAKIKHHEKYSLQELTIMLVSLVNISQDKLKEIGFNQNVELLSQFETESFNWKVDALLSTKFTPKAERVGFTSFTEFRAFVAYREENANSSLREIYPVYIKIDSKHITLEHYKDYRCIPPYENLESEKEEEPDDNIPF